MNKIYKIIWSDVRKCYVVVAEIARNRGKNNVRTIVEGLAAHSLARAGRWALPFVTAGLLLQPVSAWASTITDKNGSSVINAADKVHQLYAQEVATTHDFALNRFQKFELTRGDIANLYFRLDKNGADKGSLINLVNSKIDIQGTVNAIKGGKIDGNLFFITPTGLTVGPHGVINAGTFTGLVLEPGSRLDDLGLYPDGTFNSLWNENEPNKLAYQFNNSLFKFGRKNSSGEYNATDLKLAEGKRGSNGMPSEGFIDISGHINTRSGIVLGAGIIDVKTGAKLTSNHKISFETLVNAENTQVQFADDMNVSLTMVQDAPTGDIILRAEAVSEYAKNPISSETYDAIANRNNTAEVNVAGEIESDGKADVSADAKTTFDNSTWNLIDKFFNPSAIAQNLLNNLGFNITANWAVKNNTASVKLANTGSISAVGDASLGANANVKVVLRGATAGKKGEGTSTALPVSSTVVVSTNNKAVVDVEGDLSSTTGNVTLDAKAKSFTDAQARAETLPKNDADPANQIYLAVAWAAGDNLAQVNVKDKIDTEGKHSKITAGGKFSAKAHSITDMDVETSVAAADETFFSTAISVIDYDSAANVNLERSVEAQSIDVKAENEVANMHVTAADGFGEGNGAYVGNADYIKLLIKGNSNANVIAEAIKNKFGWTGVQTGGSLQGLENAFKNIQKYITAGAGIGVVENSNSANVTLAPGAVLKATGANGDVAISANTHMDSLHHTVTGVANKMEPNTSSNVDVAAGVLYSKIENNAVIDLKGNSGTGVTLESVQGSVNLNAKTVQTYDPLEPIKAVPERLQKLWEVLSKDFAGDWKDLSNLHSEAVTLQRRVEANNTVSETDRTDFLDIGNKFFTFLNNQIKHTGSVNSQVQKLVADISDIFSPSSYTNYYSRSYAVDSNDKQGKNVAIAGSFNIATLHNKSIVSLGEKADLRAGKNITVDAKTDTYVISGTGNGGEYFAFSESNGSGVGASFALQDFSGDSLILSGKNVSMTQNTAGNTWTEKDKDNKDVTVSGTIALRAANHMNQNGIILSAGKADNMMSVSGSVNVLNGDSNSLVLMDDETTINGKGVLELSANNDTTVTNIVGGLALGSAKTNASIGAGVAINDLGVNSIAVIGDNGLEAKKDAGGNETSEAADTPTIANQAVTQTDTDDFTKKTIEDQNKIKEQNTLAEARKIAEKRAVVRKMGSDFTLSDSKLFTSLGVKTQGSSKGALTVKDVRANSYSGGTLNAVALEGAYNSENHSGFDTVNKWSKIGEATHEQATVALKGLVGVPFSVMDRLFDVNNLEISKVWDFTTLQPIQAPNNNPSTNTFNAAAAGSVSWNNVTSRTASFIDNVSLTLGNGTEAGTLLNTASDDVFSGAWSGAAAVNWFTGGAGSASNNNAHKGGLGTALGVNSLNRDVKAVISKTAIYEAGRIENMAIKEGAAAAAALGIAVTNDSQGAGNNLGVAFGLSLNKNDSDVHALLIDTSSTNGKTEKTVINNSSYDGDVQVAGGLDIAYTNAGNNGRGIAAGITASVSEIKNDMQSGIQGGSFTGVKDMKVAGEDALTQVNVAVALGGSTSEKGFNGTASLAYADLKNTNHGYISGTTEINATGEVSVTNQDISTKKEVTDEQSGKTESKLKNKYRQYLEDRKIDPTGEKYLSADTKNAKSAVAGSDIVNIAVDVSGGKSTAAGAAITVGKVTNKFSSDIKNNQNIVADTVKGEANVHTNIVSVAAGVSVSTQNFGGAGSLSFNDLDQDNIVSMTGNRSGAQNGIAANTVSGTAKNTSHIVNVTGDFAGGKNAVGFGIAYNRMDDTTGVYAANNQIRAKTAETGVGVLLNADNDAYALALSVGAAATYKDNGMVAAHGNVGVNRGHNDTVAVIGEDFGGHQWKQNPEEGSGDWAVKDKIINASSVVAKATDKTSKTTIAGSGELSIKSSTVALGVGLALTESDKGSTKGDGKETVRAEINNAEITTVTAGDKAPVISAEAKDTSKATTVSVGVGLVKSAKFSAQGVGADARINKTVSAGLKDTSIDATSGSKAALVSTKATTTSALKTGAAAMQLSGPDSFLAGVVAVGVNRIKDSTTSGVTYTDKLTQTSMNVGNLDISAVSKGEILSVGMGASAAVKGIAAVGGSGSHNYIENNVTATIEKADINSTGNVGVVAQSDEAISNYAGVLDVAAGGQGVSAALGVTGSYNELTGKTSARIENSNVVATGSGSHTIKTASTLANNTDNEKYMIDSAVGRNTWSSGSFEEGEGDTKKYGVSRLQKGRREEQKTGVVVDASATHSISSVMANGGVAVGLGDNGIGASLAGVINLNYVSGETTAKVLDSQLNTDTTRSDVTVRAADYTNVAEFSGAASVSIGGKGAGAAGFTGTTNDVDRVTAAIISTTSATWDKTEKRYTVTDSSKEKNKVFANNFAVTADAKQAMSAFNLTGAVAGGEVGSLQTGDNVNTNDLNSSTVAMVTNATVRASADDTQDETKGAKVLASHEEAIYNLNVEAGVAVSLDPRGAAGSLNVGYGTVNDNSVIVADVEYSDIKVTPKTQGAAAKSKLSVGASNSSKLDATLTSVGVSAALFSGAVGSSIVVNHINTDVTSRIKDSNLEADTIAIDTTNRLKVTDATGTGAGALLAGIGVGVDVSTFNDSVRTILDKSMLTANDNLTINTKTQREIESTVAGVGIGAGGISVNVLAVTVNEGIEQLGVAQDADGKDTSFSHTGTINQALSTVKKSMDTTIDDLFSKSLYGMTDQEKGEMKKRMKSDQKDHSVVTGTGLLTEVGNDSKLKVNSGALTITNTELNDADLNGGSGSMGAAAVNVADVVYHLNELNVISVKNSSLEGGRVSLTTHQGNVTKNKDEAIHLQTVQAGAGALAIGVGYAGLTTKGQTGVAVEQGVLTATNGDLTVKSTDDVRSKADMIGVSAGVVAIPVSVAHNTNIANNFVTIKGSTLSASVKETEENGGQEGQQTTEKTPAYINLQTERTGRVAAKTVGVGVGLGAVIVNTAKVYDKSTSSVTLEYGTGSSNTNTNDTNTNNTNNTNTATPNTLTADAIRLEAVNAPVVKAEAGGTGVALLGVSVMQSNAEAYSNATVEVADGYKLLGDAVLAQAVIGKEGTDMTHAETHGVSGTVISVAPNKAKAITETTARVNMGNVTYKTEKKEKTKDEQGQETEKTVTGSYTNLALITQNNASRRSILGNTTIGLGVSIGTGDAKATGNDKSQVTAKGGTDANAASKLKNLKISAAGNATANGFADGDSGGITAWGAAATITMSTKTTNTASLSGAWDVAENADIGSLQQVTSRGTSKTGAGGVISVTWANSDDTVEMNTKTELKEGTQLKAGQSYVMAANKVYTNAYEGENYNNHMNVGGVIQVSPDIKSKQEIKSNASIDIGKGGTDGSSSTPKTKVATSRGQVFDAHSDIDMTNKVEGKAGGLAEHIYTYTDAFVTSSNTITVNENAVLEQKGEYESGSDITLSSSDKIKMNLVAEAYTGGLEGMVRALVDVPVTRTNRVDVNGKLSSTYDTNIYAGVNPDGTKSSLNITALAEAHNNTVIPPYTSPEVDLKLKNNQQVKVGNTGSATSVRNINVTADNGTESIKKDTVAVYWLCLGQSKDSKTTGTENGQSKVDETNNNYVNVEGLLKTGIQNNVRIDIKGALVPKVKPESGQEYTPVPADAGIPAYNGADVYVNNVKIEKGSTDDTIIKPEDIKNGDMDYATQLGEQLAALEKLISDYGTDQDKTEKKTAAYLGYVQQRQRILEEMEKRGLFKDEPVPMYQKNADGSYKKDDGGNLIPVRDANGRIQYEPGVTKRVYTTKGFTISYVEIPDITVSGGSIVVWSDNLYGKGKLQASGAPQIQINNESNAYLKLNNITVGEEGGDIRFRGTSLSAGDAGKEQINKLNKDTNKKAEFSQMYSDAASGRESAITVLNDPRIGTGNTLTVKGNNQEWEYTFVPDVAVLGNINNRHGLVRIENKQGNITIGTGASSSANVNGRMVQLIATRGSISQDYIDGILNIGGRPEDLNKTITASMIKNSNLNKEKDSHDYKPVNTTPVQSENAAGHIAGDSVYLAAADINVKGLIQSGYGKYVVDIAEDALSEANIERMKNNGSEVTINGRTLYKVNDGNKAVYNAKTDAYEYVIQVYYDPQTKGLIVEDIDTKGGKIYLTGRISSTGNGRVFAADGGAEIAITNRTKADLSTGKILNNDIEGKISITDLARKTWTEYTRSSTNSMSIPAYEKYLKLTDAYKADFAKLNDTQKVAYLNLTDTQRTEYANPATTDARRAEILGTPTETQIAEAKIVSGDGLAHNTDTTPGGQYQVKEDLRYNWTEGNDSTTTRYYRLETKSLFWGGLEYDDTTNELGKLESSMPSTPKPGTASKLGEGNFVGGALDAKYGLNSSEFAAIFENVMTTNSRTVTGSGKESGDWWALWSNPTYWVTWTTKTGSTQSYTFSLKANKPIGVGFIGQKDGSISVRNTNTQAGNVNLNGNIANNTKDATFTVESFGGSIVQKSGTTLTTGNADLSAKNNIENIHIATMGDWIPATTRNDKGEEIASVTSNDRVNLSAVSYNAGNIDVDVVGGTKDGRRLSGNR